MPIPTPRNGKDLLTDHEERLVELERRRQRESVDPTDPTPLATETVAGKAQLADEWEAHLWPPSAVPGSNLTSTIMTPARTMEMLEWFSPAVGMARTLKDVDDWNLALGTGFYGAQGDGSLNRPPGDQFNMYMGSVYNGDSAGYNSGSAGMVIQEVWEIAYTGDVTQPIRQWIRARSYLDAWGPWQEVSGGAPDWTDITGKPTVFPTDWASVAGKPATFPPSAHTHPSSQITDFNAAVDARIPAALPNATETVFGKVKFATAAEISAGASNVAVDPADVQAMIAGGITPIPPASETAAGIVELATVAEATAGTDTQRAVTPAGVKAVGDTKAPIVHTHTASQITDFSTAADARVNALVPAASQTAQGKVELATTAEVAAGTDAVRAVTPATLLARTATEARTGLVELATTAEATAGTDATRAVTPAGLAAAVGTLVPQATETTAGKAELATAAEVQAGTDTTRIVTPAGLSARTATETRTGILASATLAQAIRSEEADVVADLNTPVIMTPARVKDALNFYAPEMGLGQTAATTTNWNLATDTGFYRSEYDALNVPPGDSFSTYMGTVLNGDSLDWGSGSQGTRIQHVFEYVNSDSSYVIRSWRRVQGYLGAWGTWESDEATEAKRGIVELATSAETIAGADALRAVTPAGLHSRTATDARTGLVELATSAETATGTDATRAVTPASLLGRTSTATRIGLVELATPAEALTGTDTARAVTPQGLKGVADTKAALAHTHTSSQITDFAPAVDARIASAQTLRIAGTSAERESIASPPLGLVFYETDTRWEWVFDGSWRLTPGQILASMKGPIPNAGGANVLIGTMIATPILSLGQQVKIMSSFSQFNTGSPGVSLVNTVWQNSAADVTATSYIGRVGSRAYGLASGVVSGRGCSALFTTTAAMRVTAALYTGSATSQVYGDDGTYLWIESA